MNGKVWIFGVGWVCDVWDVLDWEAYLLLPCNHLFALTFNSNGSVSPAFLDKL